MLNVVILIVGFFIDLLIRLEDWLNTKVRVQ